MLYGFCLRDTLVRSSYVGWKGSSGRDCRGITNSKEQIMEIDNKILDANGEVRVLNMEREYNAC